MRSIAVLIISALLPFTMGAQEEKEAQKRITNGHPINIKEVPYQVALMQRYHGVICGGSIITERFVLSAAHCFLMPGFNDLVVLAGVSDVEADDGGQFIDVKKHFLHPQYGPIRDYDVALALLETALTFNELVKPALLPTSALFQVPINAEVRISGWGQLKSTATELPDQLQAVTLKVVDSKHCAKLMAEKDMIVNPNLIVCAGGANDDKDMCFGDSGGPMSYRGTVVGVASLTSCKATVPTVYGRTSEFLIWIKATMELSLKEEGKMK